MKKPWTATALAAGVVVLAAGLTGVPAASAASAPGSTSATHLIHICTSQGKVNVPLCAAVGVAGANGRLVTSAKPLATAFTPQDLEKAYDVQGLQSGGRTVAIIDVAGYPTLESDLATFRSQYGLPACSTASGCLTIEDEHGGHSYPPTDSGWDVEQALDVDSVSSICPDCKILVLQAQDTVADLEIAVDTAAATAGVVAISNSYTAGRSGDDSAYDHKGIAITAATGDYGYSGDNGQFPASDSKVTAVGGTSVFPDSSPRGFHETVWSGTGSGCGLSAQGKWQKNRHTTCSTKANSDVSAAADPDNGGLNIYIGGFEQIGGTSEATPIVAAIYALSGDTLGYPVKIPYKKASKSHLYDVTSGSNGSCGTPLCTARKGWDGPTGVGTPNGVAGF
jgi:subtilase family serine protease